MRRASFLGKVVLLTEEWAVINLGALIPFTLQHSGEPALRTWSLRF